MLKTKGLKQVKQQFNIVFRRTDLGNVVNIHITSHFQVKEQEETRVDEE